MELVYCYLWSTYQTPKALYALVVPGLRQQLQCITGMEQGVVLSGLMVYAVLVMRPMSVSASTEDGAHITVTTVMMCPSTVDRNPTVYSQQV